MSNPEFDWTEILPETLRSQVRSAQKAGLVHFMEGFPTKEEIEQAGREGREAFAKACAQVDRKRIDDLTNELRKLQDIIDNQADHILDLEARLALASTSGNREGKS
jgi:hypothetical protein